MIWLHYTEVLGVFLAGAVASAAAIAWAVLRRK